MLPVKELAVVGTVIVFIGGSHGAVRLEGCSHAAAACKSLTCLGPRLPQQHGRSCLGQHCLHGG